MAVVVRARPVSLVARVLAVAMAVMVLVWCIYYLGGLGWNASDKSLINIHIVLMMIGFVILGGEAIMSYKALPFKKDVKKLTHMVLHGVALILGIVGVCVAFEFHNKNNSDNMYSFHSWLGMAVIVLYAIQWIYGFLIFFYPGVRADLRGSIHPCHVFFGLLVFVLAVSSEALGFLEKLTFLEHSGLAKFSAEAYLVNFTAAATVLYGVFVILTLFSQADHPEGDEYSYSPL